jgi:hypothetical protein
MATANMRFWDGEEWEKRIQSLLKRYYGPSNYQELPARHGGDFGIEGYSTDGCAYQCYAKQEPCTTLELYESQRDKITVDIGKFISNKTSLTTLFGSTMIRRWILIVPRYESSKLAQHASKKAGEVLEKGLPYISSDFKIMVSTDSPFEKEINELTSSGVLDVEVNPERITVREKDRNSWSITNDNLVVNLHAKANRIPKLSTDNKKTEIFKNEMMDNYLRGQNLLGEFNENFPDLYVKINKCKQAYERHLQMISLVMEEQPSTHFLKTTEEYSFELQKSVPNLPPEIITMLKLEAISDWLMRCPLDF